MHQNLTEPKRQAIQLLSHFTHNSNFLLAGTGHLVVADDPVAQELRHVLRDFGALVTDQPDTTTQVAWAFDAQLPPGAVPIIADVTGALSQNPTEKDRPGTVQHAHYSVVDCSRRAPIEAAGTTRIDWARAHMPVTTKAAQTLSLPGTRVGIVLIIEPKTAVLALALHEAGAEVCIYAPANETDPVIAQTLRDRGVTVFAEADATPDRERELVGQLLDWRPQLLIDDGAHTLRLAHERPEVMATLRGGAEETTSGVRPLREFAARGLLRIPVIAVNDALSKTLFDNRQGTGQTCAFAISDVAEGDTWLVIGFGPVGQGVAQAARALGKTVTVAEIDAVRALEARCAGYKVVPLEEGLGGVDVVVSATGYPGTLSAAQLQMSRPDTVFAVAGGVPGEIAVDPSRRVLAGGHGVNYTAAEGNPIEIMDLSFACQLMALRQLTEQPGLAAGVYDLDPDYDQQVARWALETRGIRADAAVSTPVTAVATPIAIYSAALVVPVTAPRIRDGAVAVRNGKIIHVGERRWVLQAVRDAGLDFTEEHWDGVITPGLINAHTHLQYTDMAPVGQSHYLGFDDWSRAFDAVYDNSEHDWLASALRGTSLAIQSGTTACADVVTDQGAAAALHLAGMHGIAYWEVMGWSNEDWKRHGRAQAIADLEQIPRIPGVGVSPHAPYSLEVQPLLDVPDLVRNLGMRLHIHLGEAHFEREMRADDEWPRLEAPSFKALRSRGVGVSSTQFVDQLGVLGPDCHIAHGVYMSARDRSLLRTRGTSVALCPRSNAVIGLDMPPIADYLREGNQVSVGTDSLSSSPSLDLLEDVALLYQVAREQGYAADDLHQRLFGAATLGGAGSLGLRAGAMRAGQLAVGATADLAFFDVCGDSPVDAIAELVEAGAGTCRRTIIAGVEKWRA